MLSTVEESRGYNFQDPENAEKWKGLFVNSLKKVLEKEHPTLVAEESALQYVESLCLRLLAMLCSLPAPVTVQDVEERVARSFPKPLDKWALQDGGLNRDSHKRKRSVLPVDKLHQLLQKEVFQYKIDISVATCIAGILEYMCADVLKLTGTFVKKISKSGFQTITCGDIKTAMCADKVLLDMFYQEADAGIMEGASGSCTGSSTRRGSLTYAELVRDLLTDEKHFLRDLHLIIRVFKDEIEKIMENDTRSILLIFANIVDIYELTVTLLGNLEDAMEISQDSPTPYIGSCFEELAEVEEFRAYVRYANTVMRPESRDALQNIVDDPVLSERLDTAGHGFRLAVKYYLPALLMAPVAHVFLYHNYVLALLQIAPQQEKDAKQESSQAKEDRESFKQVECNLHPIKKLLIKALGNGPKMDATLRMASRARRQLAIDKCNELSRIVDNWDNREIVQCCNEFIREDSVSKLGPGKRVAERKAYLFDGVLLLCKTCTSIVTQVNNAGLSTGLGCQQLKLKEKLHIRKLELVDRPDTEEGRNLVELCPRVGPSVVLSLGSARDKRLWMCDLVMLNTKPMLDRCLDSILLDLEKRHPLKLPPANLYRFAVPDSPDNILLEERNQQINAPPLIKGATLLKLVERLTYHIYADLSLVRTFLTTYRSFCLPPDLLNLLIERFHIPEPSEVYDKPVDSGECNASSDAEKLSKNTAREDWKRYRKEFQQPVKFRVINVLRHWVDQHFYDFEHDPELLAKLVAFLEAVDGKPMKKWVQSVLKTLQRKSAQNQNQVLGVDGEPLVSHVFDRSPPLPYKHPAPPQANRWCPLALHPIELARQITLCQHQLYRQVKPSELVGAVWTKKDKEKTSPNLLKIIKHTTNLTRWMEKWIVESENLEERVAVVTRFLEVAVALGDLNNFNGVLAVVAACGSAAVHRLRATFQLVSPRLLRALEEFRELNSDHFRRYQERLRSINPPCVPFLGMYLTNILHIEEGNLDFLPNTVLINFSKRRKVAEITGEIQQYQNQPYCLTSDPLTRVFLDSLDPFPKLDDNEITNYLYARSLDIEPRPPHKQPPKCPRRYPELSLKPMKMSRRSQHDATSNNNSNDDNLSVSQLSPTTSTWDGTSVASLQLQDDHRGSRCEERSLISPRLERAGNSFSQLSLLDKGLLLFDKGKSTVSLNTKGLTRDEPPSPRDRHSPRHDKPTPQTERRAPALSPRGAIVDAELFYNRNKRHEQLERVPPLLPRTSPGAPPPPPRPSSPHHIANATWSPPSEPVPSPKPQDAARPRLSPKRSPAPHLSISPLVQSERGSAFSFPSAPPVPLPLTPHHSSVCGTPPPLPPRRRKESTPAVTTPTAPNNEPTQGTSAGPALGTGEAPPLPPRPAPPPALLRPAHSTILQRRHHSTSSGAPRLPPKPPPATRT